MLKRLGIVLAVAFSVTFLPYLIGMINTIDLLDDVPRYLRGWVYLLVLFVLFMVWTYIVYGD